LQPALGLLWTRLLWSALLRPWRLLRTRLLPTPGFRRVQQGICWPYGLWLSRRLLRRRVPRRAQLPQWRRISQRRWWFSWRPPLNGSSFKIVHCRRATISPAFPFLGRNVARHLPCSSFQPDFAGLTTFCGYEV